MKINEIKLKIQSLIEKATSDNEKNKKTLKFLFNELEEVKELETIERLRHSIEGEKYLIAFLLYKQIIRGNYQVELAKRIKFDDEQGLSKLLEAINADIENFEKDNEKHDKLSEQPSNSQLIDLLNERRTSGEIIIERDEYADLVIRENEEYDKIKASEFLEKHGLNQEKVKNYDKKYEQKK